ncbi:SDR family NAD(P)-dependent oxidoreductase, partial [Streptomyces canus]
MTTTNRPVALVTGASTGIGKAAALALAAAGFETVGTSR